MNGADKKLIEAFRSKAWESPMANRQVAVDGVIRDDRDLFAAFDRALATANSELRSEVLLLRTRIADVAALVSHSDYASYSTDGPSWKTSAITNIRAIIEGL